MINSASSVPGVICLSLCLRAASASIECLLLKGGFEMTVPLKAVVENTSEGFSPRKVLTAFLSDSFAFRQCNTASS